MEKVLMFKMKRAASLIQRQWALYVLRQPISVSKAEDDLEFSSNNYNEILSRSKRHSRYEIDERVDTEENHLDNLLSEELMVETVSPAKQLPIQHISPALSQATGSVIVHDDVSPSNIRAFCGSSQKQTPNGSSNHNDNSMII